MCPSVRVGGWQHTKTPGRVGTSDLSTQSKVVQVTGDMEDVSGCEDRVMDGPASGKLAP